MGIYGILRVNLAMLPVATQWAATTMAVFGAINILYGALCAFAQRDLKKLVAYSSVSHMGYCLVGIAAFTLCRAWLPDAPRSATPRSLDLPGAALLTVGVAGLLFPAVDT